jgi:hypothetical protein
MVFRLKLELPAGAVEFPNPCLLQRILRRFIAGAGIGEIAVEEKAKELIGQVVMGVDILLTTSGSVGSQLVASIMVVLMHVAPNRGGVVEGRARMRL